MDETGIPKSAAKRPIKKTGIASIQDGNPANQPGILKPTSQNNSMNSNHAKNQTTSQSEKPPAGIASSKKPNPVKQPGIQISESQKNPMLSQKRSLTNPQPNPNMNSSLKLPRPAPAAAAAPPAPPAEPPLVPVVCFNLFKGGVSKTTSLFNVAWYLAASRGIKVLLVDTDAQCNLSQLFLASADENTLANVFRTPAWNEELQTAVRDETPVLNLMEGLISVMNGDTMLASYVQTHQHTHCNNLYLLPGSMYIGEYEESLSFIESGKNMGRNVPGACFEIVQRTARSVGAQVVFVDTNPNVGTMNMMQIMTSHLVVQPAQNTSFCKSALDILRTRIVEDGLNFPNWVERIKGLRAFTNSCIWKMPQHWPQFAGVILQDFSSSDTAATEAAFHQKLTDVMNAIHEKHNCIITSDRILGVVKHFGHYAQQAETQNLPVMALHLKTTDDDVLTEAVQVFKTTGDVLVQKLVEIGLLK